MLRRFYKLIKFVIPKSPEITTPLYEAACACWPENVNLLLAKGADSFHDSSQFKGKTLVDCMQILIKAGFRLNLPAGFASKKTELEV